MKKVYLLFTCFLMALAVKGQYPRYLVQFKDKEQSTYAINRPSEFLSARAIARRTRQQIPVDSTDLPVSRAYLDSIRSLPNVVILNVSNWLNQVAITVTDSNTLARINEFSFVKALIRVGTRSAGAAPTLGNEASPVPFLKPGFNQEKALTSLDYGNSFPQIHMHSGEYLHDKGYKGEGVIIAVFDAGFFGYRTNPAFDSARQQNNILGEWDFVANESTVDEDDAHGMYCLSIMAANRPGLMIGSAPEASFYLFRTEDKSSEYPIEEQNWAAAAERADSLGADIISSSLGYSTGFNNPADDHPYPERDGNTAIVTRAADLAARKGMIVMNSAGNEGNEAGDARFVACPADGDSVMAVGAVDVNGKIAAFSSWGPNGAGKTKPDIVSLGQGTVIAGKDGNPANGNGTSFSNPNMAGLVACLWQAFPEFTNMEIIEAVKKTADRYNNPDNRFGHGIPDLSKTYDMLSQLRSAREYQVVLQDSWIKAFPVPSQNGINVVFRAPAPGNISLRLLDIGGRTLETRKMAVEQGGYYNAGFLLPASLPPGVYLVHYQGGRNRKTLKVVKE